MRTFYLIGAAGLAAATDCSGAAPYRGGLYPEPNTYVHHANNLYYNGHYITEGLIPGEYDGWVIVGPCDAGTAGELLVSCTGATPWSPTVFGESTLVTHNSFLWRNQWYADAELEPGVAPLWVNKGLCSDNAGATYPVYTPPPTAAPVPTTAQVIQPTEAPVLTAPPVVTAPPTVFVPTTKPTVATAPAGGNGGNQSAAKFYMPYVDVCLWNQPNYQAIHEQSGAKYFMLSFITGKSVCEGTWGAAYTLAEGPYTNLANDIATIRGFGGDIGVSFGGAEGTELADLAACQSGDAVANIKKAYLQVVDKFSLKHIDFDIEAKAIQTAHRSTGWKYRFEAVKQIQAERPDLKISWTLAVLPTGLTSEGLTFVNDLLAAGVKLDLLNVMTMDYGAYYSGGKTMSQCEIEAIDSLAKQVFTAVQSLNLLSTYGWTTVDDVYPYLGSTVMIGVNDVQSEVFTLDDARNSLNTWQTTNRKIQMWSNWSLTRDLPCADAWASAVCSSANVQKTPYEFASIMSKYTSA